MKNSRLALLIPGGVALLAGLDAALLLLGLPAPVDSPRWAQVHGMLLPLGFVGTLIALERAVALRRRIGYLAPAALGAGGLLLISPAPLAAGQALLLIGTVGLLALYLPLSRRQPTASAPVLIQAGGAVLAFGAALLWLRGLDLELLVPWLAGFLVLTIAGERLELARATIVSTAGERAESQLLAITAAVLVLPSATLLWPPWGYPLWGAALLALAGWLARHDAARRTWHGVGVARFSAGCLLAGYAWLAIAGAIWLIRGPILDGAAYDAVVHSVFLGFVMSMIIGHAPVILPAVLRRPLPYRPVLWLPVAALHGSLLLRLAFGDAGGSRDAWLTGGALNIAAVLLFVVLAVFSVLVGNRPAPARAAR